MTRFVTSIGFVLTAVLAFPCGVAASDQACWHEIGEKPGYGSHLQLAELQRLIRADDGCLAIALTWRTRIMPNRRSLLLWDAQAATLVRIHVEGSGANWRGGPGQLRVPSWKTIPTMVLTIRRTIWDEGVCQCRRLSRSSYGNMIEAECSGVL